MHKTVGRKENDVRLYDCNKKAIFIDDTTEARARARKQGQIGAKAKERDTKKINDSMPLFSLCRFPSIESDMQH